MPDTQLTHTANSGHRLVILGGAVLLLLTAVTRFIDLGGHELWYDEICSYKGAIDTSPRLWQWSPAGNHEHSPMPFVEMKLSFAAFGDSRGALRFPAVCYAVLGVMALYVVVGRYINWATAWWAALLLVMNPYVLEHHREARMYPAWFFYTTVAVGISWECSCRAMMQPRRKSIYGWWFGLGMIFMMMFAQTTHAILSIAGILVWLAVVALNCEQHHRRSDAIAVVKGILFVLVVFCFNWSIFGLEKLLLSMSRMSRHDGSFLPGYDDFTAMLGELSGYISPPWGLLPWVAAVCGLVLLAKQGRAMFLLLIVLAGGASWMGYSSIISRHFYISRYLFCMLLVWSVGLGAVLSALWCNVKMPGRVTAVAVIVALAVAWLPVWKTMYALAKNPVEKAMTSVKVHSQPGDALVIAPTSIYLFVAHYTAGHARAVMTLKQGQNFDPTSLAPAVWIFAENPEKRLATFADVIKAYGLSPDDYMPDLKRRVADRPYCTFRISAQGVDSLTVSQPGRQYNSHMIALER